MKKGPFAATPPLEGQNMSFPIPVTDTIGYDKKLAASNGLKLELIDLRRACLHAPAQRGMYIELPPEEHE